MVSSDPTQLCRLCLQTSEDAVNIWETFQSSTIATILVKHFWFQVNKNDGLTEWLCQMCWTQTKTFHQFYERVEQFQKCYWDSVKSDDGGNDETVAGSEPDLTMVKCEELELTLEEIDSHMSEEDDIVCNDSKLELQANNKSQTFAKSSESDDKWKVTIKRRIHGSFSRSDKLINQRIREEQNRELNGQIREWFTMKCDLCNVDDFDTWLGVTRHYRNVHQMIGYLKCCDRKFHRRCDLLAHIRQHIIAPEAMKLNAQIREYFTMKCDICPDVAFATLVGMRRHYRDAHKMRGYLICCGNKFDSRHMIIAHIRSHTNPYEHHCGQCGKRFQTKMALKGHIDSHVPLDSRAFKCNLCSSTFTLATTLKAHIRNKHSSKNGEKFPCEKCNKTYKSEFLRKIHIRQTHDALLKFVCEVCARQFKTKQVLRNHINREHSTTPQPKVQCNVCGIWLKNECLPPHVRQQHQDTKPVSCLICHKVYRNKYRLDQHIRSAHGERKHECLLCDKAYRYATGLREHVATHTGEDLYKCQYCDKTFKWSASLYSHRKSAHFAEWTQDNEKNVSLKKECVDNGVVTKVQKAGIKVN